MNRQVKIAKLNGLYAELKSKHSRSYEKLVSSYGIVQRIGTGKKIPTPIDLAVTQVWVEENDPQAGGIISEIIKIYEEIRIEDHQIAAIGTEILSLPRKADAGLGSFIMETVIKHFVKPGK